MEHIQSTTKSSTTRSAKRQPQEVKHFPEIVELAREARKHGAKQDNCLLEIGDELVKVCGTTGKPGKNNKSVAKMIEVAQEMERKGLKEYSLPYLTKLRKTSVKFPPGKRLKGVTWALHDLAPDLETLNAWVKKAEEAKKPLTCKVARDFLEQDNLAKKVQTQKENKGDANAAIMDCVEKAKLAQKGAAKLIDLAKDADDRIASHLSKLTSRIDLTEAIKLTRAEAEKAVKAWDDLLQTVSAAVAA